jgi:hypothetical protein
MNDSLQQVHSWKWNQTTGGLAFFSRALTICPKPDAWTPMKAAIVAQN